VVNVSRWLCLANLYEAFAVRERRKNLWEQSGEPIQESCATHIAGADPHDRWPGGRDCSSAGEVLILRDNNCTGRDSALPNRAIWRSLEPHVGDLLSRMPLSFDPARKGWWQLSIDAKVHRITASAIPYDLADAPHTRGRQ
jgi:hypothetical protein